VAEEWRSSSVIGSGGTFASLAAMLLARRELEGSPVHGVEVPVQELKALIAELIGMSPEERRRVPGLKPDRADIIVAGLAVIAELLALVKAPSATVSGYGIRDGLVLDMIASG
jgi:exopolyphosphatase/guanosine-5'-triphosphate,3'-diphosphate pyrophosphatase